VGAKSGARLEAANEPITAEAIAVTTMPAGFRVADMEVIVLSAVEVALADYLRSRESCAACPARKLVPAVGTIVGASRDALSAIRTRLSQPLAPLQKNDRTVGSDIMRDETRFSPMKGNANHERSRFLDTGSGH
jgi:hypothetical protein